MDQLQFFPTPHSLALRMIEMFKSKPWGGNARVLEPQAGDGALVRALIEKAHGREEDVMRELRQHWRPSPVRVDFIEMDFAKHATLKAIEGVQGDVIGLDFLTFSGSLAPFTHLVMNPPFRDGVHHLLKAWDGIFDGEIVCLLNAQTLRNPFSKERRMLLDIIQKHGRVEYVEGAFGQDDAQRKTDVEVAIVHLIKRANIEQDYLGNLFDGMDDDRMGATGIADLDIPSETQLAIPGDVIDRTVLAFKAAVRAMRESVVAELRARHCASLIGQTLAQRDAEEGQDKKPMQPMVKEVRDRLTQGYDGLKDRAWAEVLRSTEVISRLSSTGQKRLEASFESIKKLDFSKANVLSFLIGLIESQGEMNVQMALDCFDEITRYHSENCAFFMGWKSNDRHRTLGWRIKMTRFILPRFECSFGNSLYFEKLGRLRDFDKVFATLAGKDVRQTIGMADLFEGPRSGEVHQALHSSKRVSSDFFDIRWYPKRGTIHFFPRDPVLVDRLNRLVGRHRQWLPPQDDLVSDDFWLAYKEAEKIADEVEASVRSGVSSYRDPVHEIFSNDEDEAARAQAKVSDAVLQKLRARGIDPDKLIERQGAEIAQLTLSCSAQAA